MDVRYKTFANRTSQDIRFDQLLRTKPLSTRPSANSFTGSYATKSLSTLSSRKRVNVVSFTPGTDGQELITKSPEKPACDQTSTSSTPQAFDLFDADSSQTSFRASVPAPDCDSTAVTGLPVLTKRDPSTSRKIYMSSALTMQTERPQAKPPPSSKSEDQTDIPVSSSSTAPRISANKPAPSVPKSTSNDSAGVAKTVVKTFGSLPGDRQFSTAKTNRSTPTQPSVQRTQGNQAQPSKPSFSRASTSVPISNCTTTDDHTGKRPARTLLCGKNKRAAYNPRPWQMELDAEDGSPTKVPKIADTQWTDSTVNRTSLFPAVAGDRRPVTAGRPGPGKLATPQVSGLSESTSSAAMGHTVTSVQRTNPVRNFDFPDSDSDGNEDGTVRRPNANPAISAARLPKLSRLIGAAPQPPFAGVTPSSTDHHVANRLNSSREPTLCISQTGLGHKVGNFEADDAEQEDADEDEEEEEEEDVKPWFRPASRDAADKHKDSSSTSELTTNRVKRTQKPLYTLVQKVKEAHVCQERGETQHLLDDVEYLVDGLADHNQMNTRALSVLTLANKCLTASFRYLVNAHGLVKRICANLHDAHKDYTLSLTSAGLFFILSRDRDPNVFDPESLPIMLKLLSAPDTMPPTTNGPSTGLSRTNKEAERVRTRVKQLLDGLQQQQQTSRQSGAIGTNLGTGSGSGSSGAGSPADPSGNGLKRPGSRILSLAPSPASSLAPSSRLTGAPAGLNTRHLQMTRQLTASDLVLESVLNLGTRKAADWFKAELRQGGGLDRVADAAADAVDYLADLDPDNATERGRRQFRPNSVWRSSANPTGLDTFALDKLRRVCHYTKLLENMTYMNSDNQTYLVRYRDRLLVNRLLRCVRLCASHLPKQPIPPQSTQTATGSTLATNEKNGSSSSSATTAGIAPPGPHTQPSDQSILVDCVLGIFRFLVNVSHNEFASDRLGGCPGLLETVLQCLLGLPERLPDNKRFDLLVLALCLLVNLCEHCPENRTRLVHLDIPKRVSGSGSTENGVSSTGESSTVTSDDEDEDDDEEEEDRIGSAVKRGMRLTSALDELIQLFLTREEQARNHDFERDDDDEAGSEAARRRREQQQAETDAAIATANSNALEHARFGRTPTHVEEAGLKWRLIEDRKATGFVPHGGLMGRRRRSKRKPAHRIGSHRPARYGHGRCDAGDELNENESDGDDEEEDEEEKDEGSSTSEDEDDCDEDDEDDDESVGSGADVEFVADTQEEQERLAEQMSQAQRHMEDSVVAAYAALLLGCILQSSPRYADRIRTKLPDGQFRPLAIMLAKLLSFLSLTKGVGSSGSESILRIVRVLEAQDQKPGNGVSAPGSVKVS